MEDKKDFHSLLKDISEALVMTERSDVQGLSDIHTKFKEFEKLLSDAGYEKLATVAEASSGLIEKIILEEVEDCEGTFEILNQGVSGLQLLFDGGNSAEVKFPKELLAASEKTAKKEDKKEKAPASPSSPDEIFKDEDDSHEEIFEKEKNKPQIPAEKPALAPVPVPAPAPDQPPTPTPEKTEKKSEDIKDTETKAESAAETVGPEQENNAAETLAEEKKEESITSTGTPETEARETVSGTEPLPAEKPEPETEKDEITEQEKNRENEKADTGTSEKTKNEKDNISADGPAAEYQSAVDAEPDLVADFISESTEHLESCNEHLLTIEDNPHDLDALNAVFRAFHTIKGVASFLNISVIRDLAHQAEFLLDKARSEEISLTGNAIDLTFESVDTIKQMIDDLSETLKTGKAVSNVENLENLKENLEKIMEDKAQPAPEPEPEKESGKQQTSEKQESRPEQKKNIQKKLVEDDFSIPIDIVLSELPQLIDEMTEHLETAEENLLKLEHSPGDKDVMNSLFRSFHTIKGSSGFLGLVSIEKLAHDAESLLDKARNGDIKIKGAATEAIFETVDSFKEYVEQLKKTVSSGAQEIILPEFPSLLAKLEELCGEKPEPEPEADTEKTGKEIPTEKPSPAKIVASAKKAVLKETVKVDSDRLDALVDTIGELVIAETMVSQAEEVRKFASPRFIQNLSHLDKITRELQQMGTSLRMVPVHSTFQKMARLARDLSKKTGKDVDFVTSGEETELDKTVVDKIGDPLVHMVRNAIDHGIENSAGERVEKGKKAKARVVLRAYHKGGSIFIEIEDDGKGLDRGAILEKAIERGIISEAANMSDEEVFSLIFAPGFSTAKKVTEVSGRGVGMDVVKRNIEELRGQIEIQSEKDKGSIFSIKLPLTLAIIDGMVVNVGSERYIIPTLSILMSVSIGKKEINTIQGKGEVISLQDELIPVFHLNRIFDIETKNSSEEALIVIVEDDRKKTGILIDELLGQQQIVIKTLGDYLKDIPGISGGAIMPDGNVGLILDVSTLVRLANAES